MGIFLRSVLELSFILFEKVYSSYELRKSANMELL